MSPFTLPDPVTFLELVQNLEFPNNDILPGEFGKAVVEWLELQQPEDLSHSRPIVVNMARRLKNHPRLLYGLNCILQPHLRIECLTTQSTVTFYVLVANGSCEIQSMSSDNPGFPSTKEDLQGILDRNDLWQEVVGSISNTERLACIAQVLQEIIDAPLLNEAHRQTARKRLYRLGKTGILPPSIFIHFVTPLPAFESNIERSESGGFCDAHKITVNTVPLCFRVLRQWLTSDSDKIYQQFCRELSVWRQLKHPNILPLIGATTEAFSRRYCFIVPWLLHGSIMSYLETHPDHDRYLAVNQIVDGVSYLHGLNPPVSHKDLKGENVLMRSDLVCVITDFGLSGVLDTQRSRTTAALGTMSWMPPELFIEDGRAHLSPDARPRDIYSLGCTVAQMLTGKAPTFIMFSVLRGKDPLLPPSKSPNWNEEELHLWDLVRKCINFEPEERLIIQEVKRHLEVVRQAESSGFESTQSSGHEVDRKHLIGWIKPLLRSIDIQHSPYVPPLLLSPTLAPAPSSFDGGDRDIEMRNPEKSEVGPISLPIDPEGPTPSGLSEQKLDLLGPGKESERNAQDGRKRERELDLVIDLRGPKRPKSEHIKTKHTHHLSPLMGHGMLTHKLGPADGAPSIGGLGLPLPSQGDSDGPYPSSSSSFSFSSSSSSSSSSPGRSNAMGHILTGSGPPQSTIMHSGNPGSLVAASFRDDIDFHSVSPEHKKEGPDWFAEYNPNLKRTLDVNLVHTLMHESVVCCVRFSADGKYLATGCNRTAQIYNVKTGQKTCILVDNTVDKFGNLYIRSVCFSPNGKYLVTGAEDKLIRVWDIAKKRIRNIFEGHQQEVYSLDFSLDGRLIVSGSGDNTARIWDMLDGTCTVLTINDSDGDHIGVTSVAISPDGRYVAAGNLDTVIRIWDVSTAQIVDRLRGDRDSVYSVAFTPDGKGMISGGMDKTLKYWDISGLGTIVSIVKGKEGQNGGTARGLQGQPIQHTTNFSGHKDHVLSIAVSHDGQWIVSGSKDRSVQFWDARNPYPQCMLQGHKNSVISVDLSSAGNILATGSGDWQARIWRYTTI